MNRANILHIGTPFRVGDENGLQENELRALSPRSTLFIYREWMHEIHISVNVVSSRILLD